MTNAPRPLAHIIYEARVKRGMNQRDFGALLGVGQPEVSRWEAGTKKPGPELMASLAKVLGMSEQEVIAAKHGVSVADDVTLSRLTARIDDLQTQVETLTDQVAEMRAQHRTAAQVLRDCRDALSAMNDRIELVNRTLGDAQPAKVRPSSGAGRPSEAAEGKGRRSPRRRGPTDLP